MDIWRLVKDRANYEGAKNRSKEIFGKLEDAFL